MTARHILRNSLFFFVLLLNKLYEAIIKRKLWHSVGIIKFTAPKSLGHYTFLYRINTFGVANRLLLKKVQNVKSWYCKNNLQKILQLLTIFCKMLHHRCACVLNMPRFLILNILGFWICWDYTGFWICLNMPE